MSNNVEAVRRPWVWVIVGVCAVFGLAYLAVGIVGGHPVVGVAACAIMLLVAAGTVIAGYRSETVRGLIDRKDERFVGIDQRATAAAGQVLIVAVLIGAMVELARGHSGTPYIWLGALAGLAYLASVTIDRIRH
jgi:uncharacterized membrane protein